MRVKIQLNIFNSGSHFSDDKYNLALLYVVLIFIFVALSATNYKRYHEDRARFEEEDSPLYFTFGSLNMVVLHCYLKNLHHYYYS